MQLAVEVGARKINFNGWYRLVWLGGRLGGSLEKLTIKQSQPKAGLFRLSWGLAELGIDGNSGR